MAQTKQNNKKPTKALSCTLVTSLKPTQLVVAPSFPGVEVALGKSTMEWKVAEVSAHRPPHLDKGVSLPEMGFFICNSGRHLIPVLPALLVWAHGWNSALPTLRTNVKKF